MRQKPLLISLLISLGTGVIAGFPHLYFLAEPRLAERFAKVAAKWQEKQREKAL